MIAPVSPLPEGERERVGGELMKKQSSIRANFVAPFSKTSNRPSPVHGTFREAV